MKSKLKPTREPEKTDRTHRTHSVSLFYLSPTKWSHYSTTATGSPLTLTAFILCVLWFYKYKPSFTNLANSIQAVSIQAISIQAFTNAPIPSIWSIETLPSSLRVLSQKTPVMGSGGGNGSIGKLGKIKCMIRKLQTKSHQNQNDCGMPMRSNISKTEDLTTTAKVEDDAQPVYVGKTRRRYLISSNVIRHPLFQVLVKKSGVFTGGGLAVGCEVVLFEHLLWLLENTDPTSESLDELVDFYAYWNSEMLLISFFLRIILDRQFFLA